MDEIEYDDDGWGDDDEWEEDGGNTMFDQKTSTDHVGSLTSNPELDIAMLTRYDYDIVGINELRERKKQLIAQTAEVLFVSQDEAGSLLLFYKWGSKKLHSDWFNDQDKVREAVGLVDRHGNSSDISFDRKEYNSHHNSNNNDSSRSDNSSMVQCQTAFCDMVNRADATRLACGHWFCNECWATFLASEINAGSSCIYSSCMGLKTHPYDKTAPSNLNNHSHSRAHNYNHPHDRASSSHSNIQRLNNNNNNNYNNNNNKNINKNNYMNRYRTDYDNDPAPDARPCMDKCREKVPISLYKRFVKDPKLAEKYDRWLLDSFVEGNPHIKWCPQPRCHSAALFKTGGSRTITCKCAYQWCFLCENISHSPAPCDLVTKWLHKEKSDDATEIWLMARTKECPRCKVRIEKNKACNHMLCVKCGHNFCWLCKNPWKQHGSSTGGFYVCNKYNEATEKGQMSSEEKKMIASTKLLQKYTYYYKRYKGSMDGVEFTKKLANTFERKFKHSTLASFSFLMEACEKLIAARQVLAWTYSLSYHLMAGTCKNLFEYQQEMLVGSTEALQDIMESTHVNQLLDMRDDIINRMSSMDKFREEMVKQAERGDFEDALLLEADTSMEKWACSVCRAVNAASSTGCLHCKACRNHGEVECKACLRKLMERRRQQAQAERQQTQAQERARTTDRR